MSETYSNDSTPAAPESAPTYTGGSEGIREAASELKTKRREQAAAPSIEEPGPAEQAAEEVTRVEYQDGRDPKAPVTARQAAKDLGDYRESRRQEALAQAQTDALAEVEQVASALDQTEAEEQRQTQEQRSAEQARQHIAEQPRQLSHQEQELAVGLRQIEQAAVAKFPELP